MVTVEPVQLYLIVGALAILIAVIGIIFTQVFKMGFKYGANYEKNKYRRHNEVKHSKPIPYLRNDMHDTGVGSVRVRKPLC